MVRNAQLYPVYSTWSKCYQTLTNSSLTCLQHASMSQNSNQAIALILLKCFKKVCNLYWNLAYQALAVFKLCMGTTHGKYKHTYKWRWKQINKSLCTRCTWNNWVNPNWSMATQSKTKTLVPLVDSHCPITQPEKDKSYNLKMLLHNVFRYLHSVILSFIVFP